MNQHLQNIIDSLQQNHHLTEEEKVSIIKSVKDANKELEITAFKLERTEKVKKTTAVLLEETIGELEKKRKDVEAQNRELEIESALERVRAATMSMRNSSELGKLIFHLYGELTRLDAKLDRCFIMIVNQETLSITWWLSGKEGLLGENGFLVQNNDYPSHQLYLKHWREKTTNWQYLLEGKEKEEWDQFGFSRTELVKLPEAVKKDMSGVKKTWLSGSSDSFGCLLTGSLEQLSEEHQNILSRFTKVFNQTYTRFLDLQKAEAQAREAQIEAALERVRSRTMAMQKQNDLLSVLDLLVEQLIKLGVQLEVANFSNGIPGADWDLWIEVRAIDNSVYNNYVHFPRINHPYFNQVENNINTFKSDGTDLFKDVFTKEEKDSWQDYIYSQTIYKDIVPQEHKQIMYDLPGYTWSMVIVKDTWVSICRFNTTPFSNEEDELLRRFANAFGLAYTRFLDLQKAEAQSREAQIQLALERVRARTMAMQKSDELGEVALLLFEQVRSLGIETYASGFNIFNQVKKNLVSWMSNPTGSINPPFEMPVESFNQHQKIYEAWKNNEDFLEDDLTGEALAAHYKFLRSHPLLDEAFKKSEAAGIETPGRQVHNIAIFSQGFLLFITFEQHPEFHDIFIRFAKVFNQTYTRFLDLQKAEAQARESQIQLALERVRARTMAMQKSEELLEVINIFSEQLTKLNIYFDNVSFGVNKQTDDYKFWMSSAGQSHPIYIVVPYCNNPAPNRVIEAQKEGLKFFADILTPEENRLWFQHLVDHSEIRLLPDKVKSYVLSSPGFARSTFIMKNINLYIGNYKNTPYTEEENNIFNRFAQAFEQSYIRFLDLQKAEAQAREAQIQLALERVRARTMAMHKSDELREVVAVIYEQLQQLGFIQEGSCNINIMDASTGNVDWWMTGFGNQKYPHRYHVEYINHPMHITQLAEWKRGEKYTTIEVAGDSKKEFDRMMLSQADFEKMSEETKKMIASVDRVIFSIAFMKYGALSWAANPITKEQANILQRFAKVFEQTYTRFLDLQKAEAQAKEAQIEAALEKVRSRTLAMQKSDELAETAAVLFQQLIHLGIEPNRLYISIIQNDKGDSEFWITDEDGSKVSALYAANLNENISFKKMLEGWREQKKSLILDMQGEELENYFKYLSSLNVPFKGGLSQKRRWQYIAYFSKGFIGMASPDEQSTETMQLLERFAGVFNLTFTRFNDLQVAEAHALQAEQDLIEIKAARKKAEETLTELQSTQKQLIQSEKMASLGELTAGIAHEIQNPLNFVNNFSEVSKELLDEMKDAMDKGDPEEAKEIMRDVINNLEKINHHGKRADGIVKGMLQHSRSSTGQKEMTDINALADEYLRLSYHGLRAKDKSFNAKFETNFDPSLPKINVVPQEVGRVILNLINNAFYAVNERKKLNEPGYEPEVIVSTRKERDKVEIKVKDNGTGIPKNIVDKIFQPFFTTKPTGSGTGLGLSLSYDIVKAHGGEIKVGTKENEGTTFTIQLLANSVV